MESVKRFEDIQPDTSLYENPINKGLARAKCALAQEGGAQCEIKGPRAHSWSGNYTRYEFTDSAYTEYRVKPVPAVTTKYLYDLYVPKLGAQTWNDKGNFVKSYETRKAALDEAARFIGCVLIDQVKVTFEDGVEVKRESMK